MIDPNQSTSPAVPAQAACDTCRAHPCVCDVTLDRDGSDEADALAAGIPEHQSGMSPVGRELFGLASDLSRMQAGIAK